MSRLTCIVCGLSNPEGLERCNQCASPLGLQWCYRCEAINTLSARQCSQCGALLLSAQDSLEETPVPPAASHRAENAFGPVDSVPIALAERLEAVGPDLSAPPYEAPVDEPPAFEGYPSSADPATTTTGFAGESPGHADESPRPEASTERADHADEPAAPAFAAEPAGHVVESSSPVEAFTEAPAHPVDEPPSAAAFTGEPAGSGDGSPSRLSQGYRPIFSERSRNRVGGFLLAAILVAAAVTIYWLIVRPMHPSAENGAPTESTVAPQAAPDSAASSPQRANPPNEAAEGAQPRPNAAAPRGSSDSSALPTKPDASAASRVPSETIKTPESAAAQAPSAAGNRASVDGGTAKAGSAPAPGDARRRAPAPQRSKEQADRDASATQRLIERELGDPRRSDSDTKPPVQ